MGKRRRGLGRDDAGDWWKLHRHFVEHQNLVESNLDVLIEFGNDVNTTQALRNIQRRVLLVARNFSLQDALQAIDARGRFVLSCRIRFESNGCEECSVDDVGSELDLLR